MFALFAFFVALTGVAPIGIAVGPAMSPAGGAIAAPAGTAHHARSPLDGLTGGPSLVAGGGSGSGSGGSGG